MRAVQCSPRVGPQGKLLPPVVTQSGTSDDLAKALLDGFAHLIGDFINAIGQKATYSVRMACRLLPDADIKAAPVPHGFGASSRPCRSRRGVKPGATVPNAARRNARKVRRRWLVSATGTSHVPVRAGLRSYVAFCSALRPLGRRTVNTEPLPGSLATVMSP